MSSAASPTPKSIAVLSRSFSRNAVLRAELLARHGEVVFNDSGRTLAGSELIDFVRPHDAAVVALDGAPIWRQIESVAMDVRPLTPAFVDAYLDADWEHCQWCVGCYRIEGPGAQLFAKVTGSLFAVQGLPLLPLLDFLRARGVLAS